MHTEERGLKARWVYRIRNAQTPIEAEPQRRTTPEISPTRSWFRALVRSGTGMALPALAFRLRVQGVRA